MEWLEDRTLLAAFTVNSELDKIDLNPGDGVVDTDTPGKITLRAAIMEANALAGDDTINLPTGTYTLSIPGTDEDAAARGDLDITDTTGSLTVLGAGAATTIIDAAGLDRVLHVVASATLDLSGVTVTGGNVFAQGGGICNSGTMLISNSTVSGNSSGFVAGGIWNNGTMTVTDSSVSGNLEGTAYTGGGGGGIWNQYYGTLTITNSAICNNSANSQAGAIQNNGGVLTIIHSNVSGNSSGGDAGGIYSVSGTIGGTLTIINSTVSGNSAVDSYRGGGGIYSDGTATIINSTVSDNSAGSWGGGGGIYHVSGTAGTLTIINSTLSGNSAGYRGGGGIHSRGTATIIDSTLSGNSAERYGGGICNVGTLELSNSTLWENSTANVGGGIYNWDIRAVNPKNTIIAGNTATTSDPDVSGDFNSQGHNLIGDVGSASGFTDGVNGDQVGGGGNPVIDPLLGPLKDNAGPTFTHALLPGSPAIDAGDANLTPPPDFDQRGPGFPRVVDGDLDGSAVVDIGAFEYVYPIIPLEIDVKPGSDPNPINLASKGVVAIAIFTTDDFDASRVDVTTVQFAGARAVHSAMEDVDQDGDLDLVLHFRVQDTALLELYADLVDDLPDDYQGSYRLQVDLALTGQTTDGQDIEGSDTLDLFLSGKNLRDLVEELAVQGAI